MALQVVDEELFNKIRNDFNKYFRTQAIDKLQSKYEMEPSLLLFIITAKSYEEFCEDKGL